MSHTAGSNEPSRMRRYTRGAAAVEASSRLKSVSPTVTESLPRRFERVKEPKSTRQSAASMAPVIGAESKACVPTT